MPELLILFMLCSILLPIGIGAADARDGTFLAAQTARQALALRLWPEEDQELRSCKTNSMACGPGRCAVSATFRKTNSTITAALMCLARNISQTKSVSVELCIFYVTFRKTKSDSVSQAPQFAN
jgi:hypothetical protein